MTKLLSRPPLPGLVFPGRISLEEEFEALSNAADARAEIISTLADTQHILAARSALNDLALVTDTITVRNPTLEALVQIAGDAATSAMEVSGDLVTPAMEDFSTGAEAATKIRAFIEKIIKAIYEAAKFVYEKMQVFLINMNKTLGNSKERFDEVYRAYSSMPNRQGTKSVKIPTIIVGGQEINSPSQFGSVMRTYLDTMKKFVAQSSDFEEKFRDQMVDFFADTLKTERQGDHLLKGVKPLMDLARMNSSVTPNKEEDSLERVTDDNAGFHIRVNRSEPLFGGIVILRKACQEVGDFKDDLDMVPETVKILARHAKFSIKTESESSDAGPMMEIEPLSKSGVKEVLTLAEMLLNQIHSSDPKMLYGASHAQARRAKEATRKITRSLSEYSAAATTKKAYAEAAADVCDHMTEQATIPYLKLMGNTLKAYNACLNYAMKSIRAAEDE